MKIAVQGIFNTDLRDINYESVRFVSELGFHGLCTHITVPAESIPDAVIANARDRIKDQGLAYLQLWGKYPCIISPDERIRAAGVAQVREMCKLTARLGVPGVGVRPTSLNPRGDWWPHPGNYLPETEDRLVRSLSEISAAARDHGLQVVLECHQTSTLDTPENIKRIIERSDPGNIKINLDLCNFVTDIRTAFNPAPMLRNAYAVLAPYTAAVHLKDYYLEDRLVAHIAETVIGTGLMDWDTALSEAQAHLPGGWLVIEHLPVSMIPLAKQNLTEKLKALAIPIG